MNRDELFTRPHIHRGTPDAADGADRAHSPLRDYVLNALPSDLARASNGEITYAELGEICDRVVDEATPYCEAIDDLSTARVAQLDLCFLLSGFLPAGPEFFPGRLTRLIAGQCERFPELDPHMSYELLIDVNCEQYELNGDIRVFSEGEFGGHERDFYLGHYLSEPLARSAAHHLRSIVMEPETADVLGCLEEVARSLDEFRLHMAQYGRLPKDAFDHFRRYHTGYPGGPRGASGAFMPSVQLTELALLPPTAQYGIFLDEALPYYPVWSRPVISRWRRSSQQGENISQFVRDGRIALDKNVIEALAKVVDKFTDFRMVHLGVTRKSLPQAFQGAGGTTRRNIAAQPGELPVISDDVPGTSGFSARNVLTNSVFRLLEFREELAAMAGKPLTAQRRS